MILSTGKSDRKKNRAAGLRQFSSLLLLLLLIMLKPAVLAGKSLSVRPGSEIRWFSVFIGQEKVGFIKEYGGRLEQNGKKKFRTVSESRIVFNRLGKRIEMVLNSESLESESGLLEKIRTEEILSGQSILIEAEVEEAAVRVKTTAGGRSYERELKFSGQLLGPAGIASLTQEKLKNPGDRVEFQTLMAELGQVVKGERILVGEEEINLGNKPVKTRRLEEKYSGLPQVRSIWLDEQGNEVRAEEPSPFGQMVVVLSEEQEATAGLESTSPVQDQFSATLLRANVRLPQARDLDRLVVRLKHRKPELGWPQLESDGQKIIKKNDGYLEVEIKKVEPGYQPKISLTAGQKQEFLKSNLFLQPDDAEIKKTAETVAGGEKDDFKKALKLRDWVAGNMSFDPGFVFAPASEVIKTRKATCAGYAALLASLLRAAGLPSRYVVGLAYVNGVWGGHAWVEGWIRGRWIPLDAALSSPGVADAARLAIGRSSLDEGLAELLLPAQKVMGHLEIEILEYEFTGQNFRVMDNQLVYEVRGNRYRNFGLQLTLEAPAGFEFTALDRVWPDRTLVVMKNRAGESVKLTQEAWLPNVNPEKYLFDLLKKEVGTGRPAYVKVWGKKRPMLAGSSKSALALRNGTDVFILTVEGGKPSELMKQVLRNFHCGLVLK